MARHFIYASIFLSSYLIANPTGGTTDSGVGAFNLSGTSNNLIVTTASPITAISWNQFSSSAGETLTFQSTVISGNYYVLNTVTGGSPSTLNGFMTTGNQPGVIGNIYLVNPSGITVGATGQIIAGSFLGSTLQLAGGAASFNPNADMTYGGASTTTISNLGSITSTNGDVILIGYRVVNSGISPLGVLSATGTCALGAGVQIIVQPTSSTRIAIVTNGASGGLGYGIDSDGTISADVIQLLADGNPYTLAINQTANAQLNLSACTGEGSVSLIAASPTVCAGAIEVSGLIQTTGCPVVIDGETIAILSGVINTSNNGGDGGIITIGNLGLNCPTTNVYIDPASQLISTSNAALGTGGAISVNALTSLLISGTTSPVTIQSNGNSSGGTGGLVTLTSNGYLGLDALVNVSGINAGTLNVIAPNINVGGAANYGSNFTSPDFIIVNVSPIITTSALEYALNNANLTASANGTGFFGNITVADNFNWAGGSNLTLDALNTIQVNYHANMTSSGFSSDQVLILSAPYINIGPAAGNSPRPTGFHLTSGGVMVTANESLALYGGSGTSNSLARITTLNGSQQIIFGDILLLEAGAITGAHAEIQGTNIAIDKATAEIGAIILSASCCAQAYIKGTGIEIGQNLAPSSLTILGGTGSNNSAYIGNINNGLSNINITLSGGLVLSGGASGTGNIAAIASGGGLNGTITINALDINILGGITGTTNQAYIASSGVLGVVDIDTSGSLSLLGGGGVSNSASISSTNTSFTVAGNVNITGGTGGSSSAFIQGNNASGVAVTGLIGGNLTVQGGTNQSAFAEIRAINGNIFVDAITLNPNIPNESWFTFRGGFINGAQNASAKIYIENNGSIFVGYVNPPNYVYLTGGAGGSDSFAELLINGNGSIFVKTISDITYLGGLGTTFTHAAARVNGIGTINHVAGRDFNLTTGNSGPSDAFLRTVNGAITVDVYRDLNMTGDCNIPNIASIVSNGVLGGLTMTAGRDVNLKNNAHIRVDNGTRPFSLVYGGVLTVTKCSTIIYGNTLIAPVPPVSPAARIPIFPSDAYYKYIFLYELFYRLSYFKCYDWFEFHDSFWNSTMYTGPGNQPHLDQ